MSSMLIYQHLKNPFFHKSTILDVVHHFVLSLLNADDCVLQLQKLAGIDSSCILVPYHAGTCRSGCRAWTFRTGCALKFWSSAAHHGVSKTAPCHISSSELVRGWQRSRHVRVCLFSSCVLPQSHSCNCRCGRRWTNVWALMPLLIEWALIERALYTSQLT